MNPDLLIGRLAVFALSLRQLLVELDPQQQGDFTGFVDVVSESSVSAGKPV